MSVFYFIFTLALFSELSSRWRVVASPANSKMEGGTSEDGMGLILNEKMISEPALGFLMRRSTPQINLLSDMRMRGRDGTGASFSRGIASLTDRNSGQFPESIIKIDRRDTDLDMLRCMIGRVYRPCWEV